MYYVHLDYIPSCILPYIYMVLFVVVKWVEVSASKKIENNKANKKKIHTSRIVTPYIPY